MKRQVWVYEIRHVETNHSYVGSTVTLGDRWTNHRYELNRNTHHTPRLQNAWNKYGKDAFEFRILETRFCESKEERKLFELGWIDKRGYYNEMTVSDDNSNFSVTEELRQYLSRKGDEIWQDEDYRERTLKSIRETAKRPEMIAHREYQLYRIANDPEIRKNYYDAINDPAARKRHKDSVTTESFRKITAQNTSERWKDQAYKETCVKAISEAWTDERRKDQSERTTRMNNVNRERKFLRELASHSAQSSLTKITQTQENTPWPSKNA